MAVGVSDESRTVPNPQATKRNPRSPSNMRVDLVIDGYEVRLNDGFVLKNWMRLAL